MTLFRSGRVHVATVGDGGVLAVFDQRSVAIGTPKDISKLAFVRGTYPACYNHGVKNMNGLISQTNEPAKRSMRGGHFLLYRYMVFLAFLLCWIFGIASIYIKAFSAIPFALSILYTVVAIYNISIYRLNRPLLHPHLTLYLSPQEMPRQDFKNLFYSVPILTNTETSILGALVDPARIVAALHLENSQVDHLEIMVFTDSYVSDTKFPKECVFYLIIFVLMFFLSIVFVSSTIKSN
jgi:hypothetical protein